MSNDTRPQYPVVGAGKPRAEIPGVCCSAASERGDLSATTQLPEDLAGLAARHTAVLFETTDELVGTLHPFVAGGIEVGDAVIAVATRENIRALRESLGPTPPSVRFVDGEDWYARPPDTMGRWVSFVEDELALGRPGVRIIGEVVWPENVRLHWEMKRFEAASTQAWIDRPALVVCPYNTTRLPDSIIQAAMETHPGVIERGVAAQSAGHVPPARMVRESLPLLGLPDGSEPRRFERADFASVADFVEARARLVGLPEFRVQSLVAAACEIAANAFEHAASAVIVTAWSDDGELAVQLEDDGPGVDDPAVGYQPPFGDDRRWGLWLARQRTDAIQLGRGADGTAVRLTVRRNGGGAPVPVLTGTRL